jgi:SAM-dependent methyltransferase
VRFGTLRRTSPISHHFGYERGTPVDRHYIERFLGGHRADVRGAVLEIGDDAYTRRFGGGLVTRSEVLDIDASNRRASLVDDLAAPRRLPREAFDCFICTQTLHLIFDIAAAVRAIHDALAPGGVALVTVPGISQIDGPETVDWYWGVTRHAARRLFGEAFGADRVEVRAYGNVLAATAFLQGLAAEELRPDELAVRDPCFDVVVAVRAARAERPTAR